MVREQEATNEFTALSLNLTSLVGGVKGPFSKLQLLTEQLACPTPFSFP